MVLYVKIALFFLLLAVLSISARGQTCDEFELIELKQEFRIGRFSEVKKKVNACLKKGFATGKQKEEALAILAKSYLESGELQLATTTLELLLRINPDYEPASGDPGLFKQLINSFKLATIAQTVSSVSKREERIKEAPATVLVITEQDIIDRGYVDLEQLFNDLPGFDVSRTFGISYSNIYQRGYRSDNTDRTLFLIDGVEDNDIWSGGVYMGRKYPITNVKRVEVVYGPASTMYGANAFLGVVNVVTKDKQSFKPGQDVALRANLGYGSYQTSFADVSFLFRKNNVSGMFTVKRFYAEEMDLSGYPEFNYDPADYDLFDYKSLANTIEQPADFAREHGDKHAFSDYFALTTNAAGDTTGILLTDKGAETARQLDKDAMTGELNGNPIRYSNLSDHWLFYGKLKILDFTIGFHTWQSKLGTANYYHDNRRAGPENGSVWQPKQTFIYSNYQKELRPNLSIKNSAQFRITEVGDQSNTVEIINYSNKRIPLDGLLAQNSHNGVVKHSPMQAYWDNFYISVISKQFRNEFNFDYSPTSKLDIISGVELKNSIIQGDYRKSTDHEISAVESGTSAGDTIPGGNDYHQIDIGVYAQATYRAFSHLNFVVGGRYDYNRIRVTGGYGGQFSPRLAAIYTPSNFIVKAIYAQAFQNASILKKFATTDTRAPNPNLKPEKAKNYELSFGYNHSKQFNADIGLYYASYKDIASVKDGLTFEDGKTQQFIAIGESQVFGIQANMSGKWRNYSWYANYTFTNPKNNKIEKGELSGELVRVGDIASHQFNMGVTASFGEGLRVHMRTNYIGERRVGAGTSVPDNPGEFPPVLLLNGTLSYRNILPGLSLQLIGNNLLNTEYFDPGIRTANASLYAYRIPQHRRNYILRLEYDF